MQVIPRPDMARGLSPREQPVAIPYPAGTRGTGLHQLTLSHLPHQAGERPWARGAVVCWLCVCEVVATFSRRPEANDLDKFCWFALDIRAATDSANLPSGYGLPYLPLLSGCLLQVDHYSTLLAALLLTDQSVFGSTKVIGGWWVTAKCIRCSYIQKLMDRFLLFTAGPLLLSVKGIIDLAQMPPTILLPHPGGTGTPTLERIAYLPGAQPPFPPRAFNPTSISPGEDPPPHPYTQCSLIYLATISMFPHTSVRVQPCTGSRCQRSVLPVQSQSKLNLGRISHQADWCTANVFYFSSRKKKSCSRYCFRSKEIWYWNVKWIDVWLFLCLQLTLCNVLQSSVISS